MKKSISIFISELQQGLLSKRSSVFISYSMKSLEFLRFLYCRGFINEFFLITKKNKKKFQIGLKIIENRLFLQEIKQITRANFKVNISKKSLEIISKRLTGVMVLETSIGILTHFECLALGLGGQPLCILFF